MESILSDLGIHDRIIRILGKYAALSEADRRALRQLPISVRALSPSSYLVREGERPTKCALLLDGFVYRQKLTVDGARALLSLRIPDDFLDLQNMFLKESDHSMQALTPVRIAEFLIADLQTLVQTCPGINAALWKVGLIEASMYREWLLSVGRRHARSRIAHLLCEVALPLDPIGLAKDGLMIFR